ncbi:hypothetical protein ABY42_18355 (plasmid) [Haloferax gibbonsii]|uniref:Uncharacterized protein n=1 Tax=Haloferax gibbonsii TaxID=35746 RepID=A0A0K1IZN6_HALGI|nr:hypothetical protein ABY42_18355 [Haloferax gibbonsii]
MTVRRSKTSISSGKPYRGAERGFDSMTPRFGDWRLVRPVDRTESGLRLARDSAETVGSPFVNRIDARSARRRYRRRSVEDDADR